MICSSMYLTYIETALGRYVQGTHCFGVKPAGSAEGHPDSWCRCTAESPGVMWEIVGSRG